MYSHAPPARASPLSRSAAERARPRRTEGRAFLSNDRRAIGARIVQLAALLPRPPAVSAPCQSSARSPTAGGNRHPVQRYTVEHGHRVSAARELATSDQPEQKILFAKPAVITRADAILEGMNSPVTLQAGAAAPETLAGMVAATPVNRTADQPLFDVNECIDVADRVTHSGQTHAIYQPAAGGAPTLRSQRPQAIGELNELIRVLTTTADVTPAHIVRAQDPDPAARRFRFTFDTVAVDTDAAREASDALTAKIRDRNLRIALLLKVLGHEFENMPSAQQTIVDRVAVLVAEIREANEDKDDDAVDGWTERIKSLIAQMRAERSTAYAQMDPAERSRRAALVGVNEQAQPAAGESYATIGTRERAAGDRGKWNMHFAAVIARDGADSVTLENFNREEGAAGNAKWYFDMHGPAQQSFHEKHKDTVADGVTLRMGEAATADMRAEFLARITAKLAPAAAPAEIGARIEAARTRAELAAIYAEATGR